MELHVMSGAFATGKTTWIERLLLACGLPVNSENPALADARPRERPLGGGRGLRVAGVYTPAVFERGSKTAIDAVLLPGCERFRFAERRADAGLGVAGPPADGRDGRPHRAADSGPHADEPRLAWDFHPEALARANGHLAGCADCDLLVLDELGPLELARGQGFTQALRLLDAAAVPHAFVVVRPALLDAARARWGDFELLDAHASVQDFAARLVHA